MGPRPILVIPTASRLGITESSIRVVSSDYGCLVTLRS
jgi:hypothetical protein